ncbi:hypothetical protein ANANG_G00298600 [Anguilla anguilla]|uniref:Uncharacterized protein n=1 Tax=Anguilla anguilla TaxID=7936 RepID=A0A9D3LIP7_ANGAN|nr:hypothetical protein ANANG_G00298600 [Anguilla anguilla]
MGLAPGVMGAQALPAGVVPPQNMYAMPAGQQAQWNMSQVNQHMSGMSLNGAGGAVGGWVAPPQARPSAHSCGSEGRDGSGRCSPGSFPVVLSALVAGQRSPGEPRLMSRRGGRGQLGVNTAVRGSTSVGL